MCSSIMKDYLIFRSKNLTMSNLNVARAGFWQQTAMLELSCKAGSLLRQLTFKLGHPHLPHFPTTTVPPVFKKKSPSCLRCQELWLQEAPNKETQRNYPET